MSFEGGGGRSKSSTGGIAMPFYDIHQISKLYAAARGAAAEGQPEPTGEIPEWEQLSGGDWDALEKALYERPASQVREEMEMMEPRLYSTLAKRGVGDSPEIVARNVSEALVPFSRRFGELASGATEQRYNLQQQSLFAKNLGMERRWMLPREYNLAKRKLFYAGATPGQVTSGTTWGSKGGSAGSFSYGDLFG